MSLSDTAIGLKRFLQHAMCVSEHSEIEITISVPADSNDLQRLLREMQREFNPLMRGDLPIAPQRFQLMGMWFNLVQHHKSK